MKWKSEVESSHSEGQVVGVVVQDDTCVPSGTAARVAGEYYGNLEAGVEEVIAGNQPLMNHQRVVLVS